MFDAHRLIMLSNYCLQGERHLCPIWVNGVCINGFGANGFKFGGSKRLWLQSSAIVNLLDARPQQDVLRTRSPQKQTNVRFGPF